MKFNNALVKGTLLKRYKRFLADVELEDGTVVGCHCTNTGSMKGVLAPPQAIWMSPAANPKRKLPFTMEVLEVDNTHVGVNTHRTNHIARHALEEGLVTLKEAITLLESEKKYGTNSRIDLLAHHEDGSKTYIEVKNVSLKEGSQALFPDSPTERGRKHLRELMDIAKGPDHALMLFISQRDDVDGFSPAKEIDPEYAMLTKEAQDAGVQLLAYACTVSENGIVVTKPLPITLD